MAKCDLCGKEVDIPFKCNYCEKIFCANHRLPELHDCPNLIFARSPHEMQKGSNFDWSYRENKMESSPIFNLKFSSELQQLLIAWLVLSFCFSVRALFTPENFPTYFIISLITLGLGFIGHELTHRFVARNFGCWAEFRLWPLGLVMALAFALLSGGSIIFAAPGAVYIVPRQHGVGYGIGKRENGIISISGPLANITVGIFFFMFKDIGGLLGSIGSIGFAVNFWLAAFNLIPFGMMDGRKVFAWSPIIWALVAIPTWLAIFFF
jgi:Zn-dependent protease